MKEPAVGKGGCMDSLTKELMTRIERLEMAVKSAKDVLKDAPEGSLRINRSASFTRFYHITQKGDTRGRYLPMSEKELVAKLANKDYAQRLLAEAERELMETKVFLQKVEKNTSESIHAGLIPQRQELVDPILRNEEERIRYWNSLPYSTSSYEPEEKIFQTRRGEMVRSKSELLIADMYYELGIPYRYECALKLKNGKVKHPDFTLYHAGRRMVLYHEHLGRLDDEGYRLRNMKKLRQYEESEICLGKNLLVSWEAAKFPFNIQVFRKEIEEIFWL